MSDLKIYPSGFSGSALVPQTAAPDAAAVAKEIFNRSQIRARSKYTASLEVQTMWETLTNGGREALSFGFKEKILQLAMSHFGQATFTDWVQAQWDNPEYGDNHARYIDETIGFVYHGTRRPMGVHAWCAILTAGGNTHGAKAFSPLAKKTLFSGPFGSVRHDLSWAEFVTLWVRQPNGINDLANSLQVLFGAR